MKRLLYLCLILSVIVSCSSESEFREEVLERYAGGEKKLVASFRGQGANEQLVERYTYDESGELIQKEDLVKNTKLDWAELHPEIRERHIKHYFELFGEFCLGQSSQQEASNKVTGNGRLNKSKEFEGTYVESYEGINYGITPGPEACTADVLLEFEKGKLLMSLNDVHEELEKLKNYRLHKKEEKKEISGSDSEPFLVESRYYYPSGSDKELILLTYPLSNKDNYYMTLDYLYDSSGGAQQASSGAPQDKDTLASVSEDSGTGSSASGAPQAAIDAAINTIQIQNLCYKQKCNEFEVLFTTSAELNKADKLNGVTARYHIGINYLHPWGGEWAQTYECQVVTLKDGIWNSYSSMAINMRELKSDKVCFLNR